MSIPSVIETTCVVLIVFSTAMAGCLDSSDKIFEEEIDWDKNLIYLEDPLTHEDAREFIVGSPSTNDTWGESFWAVFGNEEGGNCCEHYLAGTKEGWIVNFGGEYPTWSEDRGHTWQEYQPTIFSQIGCMEPKPTLPGQEGLGEEVLFRQLMAI